MAGNTTVKVYNADEVIVTFGGVIDTGLADGEFLRIERETNITEDVAGTDGEVAISRTNDKRGTATIMVMQTSDGNDILSTLANLAEEAPGMTGAILPFGVADLNGRTLVEGANAWCQKSPDRSFDRTAQTNEWEIRIAHLKKFDGGN